MKEVSTEEYEKNIDDFASADWKASPHGVLESIDSQIKEFGLEVVIYEDGGDCFVWKINRIEEEIPIEVPPIIVDEFGGGCCC